MLYDKKHNNQYMQWEYSRHEHVNSPLPVDYEHYQQLLLEAEEARLAHDLPRGPSWTARLALYAGAWMVKAGCRLERLGFGRLGALPAGSSPAMDCDCA